MDEKYGPDIVRHFFSGTGATYDHIVNLFTMGFDSAWKRKILDKIPKGSVGILDQACGTGILTFRIAEKFPEARIVGVDITDEYLREAQAKANRLGIANIEFILGRAEDVLLDRGFDCVTSSYLAKYAELEVLVPNIKAMLRDGGKLVMHDFTYPGKRSFAVIWELYCWFMRIAGTWKYPQWKNVFEGLPGFLRETNWVADLVEVLRKNHFSAIQVQSLTFGSAAIVTARKHQPGSAR
jgi:demethylmenaquinone methyltransferase/2-methoxy-6-polyprenyl-1,4-benzoquinol methylase